MSAVLVQAVNTTTMHAEPMCVTLGNQFSVLSTKLAKLSILYAADAAQKVLCHIVPEQSALVILGMDWLT